MAEPSCSQWYTRVHKTNGFRPRICIRRRLVDLGWVIRQTSCGFRPTERKQDKKRLRLRVTVIVDSDTTASDNNIVPRYTRDILPKFVVCKYCQNTRILCKFWIILMASLRSLTLVSQTPA